jgi:chaperone modulatory protein CbpM
MAKITKTVITAELLDEDVMFDLPELCQVCGIHAEFIIELIEYGVVEPKGETPIEWVFDVNALKRSTSALRLSRDFNLNAQALALILDLLDEIKQLREEVNIPK